MEGMRIGVKVEKPENYDGNKGRDLYMWLFHVQEHLQLTMILVRGHVPYATLLLRGNVTLRWRKLCEANNWPATWDDFCRLLHEQF